MLRFTRGSTILFTANAFLDSAGASMTPSTVTVYLSYPSGNINSGQYTDTSFALTNAAGNWTGQWESELSQDGQVFWSVKAVGSDDVAIDGEFQLTANKANPDP
jgi:hypothetical protein